MRQLARRLAAESGFTAGELEGMTLGDLRWWLGDEAQGFAKGGGAG